MKKLHSKIFLAVLTFFIGVGAFALWYLFQIDVQTRNSLPDAVSSVESVVFTGENPCDFPRPEYREIEAHEAVYMAECFVIENGYTDLPPSEDKSKIVPESVWGLTDEEGMKMRHDSLERKAYSYYPSDFYDGGWIVMFRRKPHPEVLDFYGDKLNYIGRAVVVDSFGKNLRIKHSDYPLIMPGATVIEKR